MPFILPDPVRKKRLHRIQHCLAEYKSEANTKLLGEAVMLMLEEDDFKRHIALNVEIFKAVRTDIEFAWRFLYFLLNKDDYVAAAMVLWNRETFCAEPHCTQLVWGVLMEKRMICIIGGGGMGKTYSTSAYFLLSWLTDPAWTRIQLASASKDHLYKNLYADMIRLHADASMILPGSPDTESISLEKKRGQGIFTLVLPGGPQSKGKIKGSHTKPRPPHPRFGNRSRVFALIDESQECPQNIFEEIPNRFSTVDGDDVDHIKFVICANPKSVFSQFGACAKPARGWDSISRGDEIWESESGWTVISLDAMKHENVVQRKKVFPGFVTWDGVQIWLRKAQGNWDDPIMFTYVFGKFPPMGLATTVIKQQHLTASEGEWRFDSATVGKAGADPAYTGDRPALATGRVGRAVGWVDLAGAYHELKEPKWAIQVDSVSAVPRGDSQDLADEYMMRLKPLGIEPDGFAIDMTGAGLGTHDIIRRQWSSKVKQLDESVASIMGIHYANSPSEAKITNEDTQTPKEQFDRIATELWFAGAKLFEFDTIRIGRGVDLKVFAELAARQGGMQVGLGRKLTIESKETYKQRTGLESPDLADATLLMIHAARLTTPGLIPKAKDTQLPPPMQNHGPWDDTTPMFAAAELGDFGGVELPDLMRD